MMKRLLLAILSTVLVVSVFAQSVEDGKKFLYYEQLKKAKDAFKTVLAASPTDPEALYWLGQAYIYDDSVQLAKDLYAKSMTSTNQNPLIMVGMGHVELLEKKNTEAKAHFDAAIEATKSRKNKKYGDFQVLAATGRALADGGTDIGDPAFWDYGIEKLKQAAELEEKNAEVMANVGLLWLKKGGEYGGQAKRAFEDALDRDPTYARSNMRIGRIFESQRNVEKYLEYYNKAIDADPKYAPAYLALYNYYQNRDVNKAKELLDKYIANTEKDRETDFFYADYLFRAGKYQESLDKAKLIEANLNGETYAKLHKLYSLDYDRLGDSVKAMQEMELYLKEENPAKIDAENYADMAALYAKTHQDASKIEPLVQKAVTMDTLVDNKLKYMKMVSDAFGAQGNYKGQYTWLKNMMDLRSDTTARNFYFLIDAAIKAEEYAAADTFSNMYIASYPDQAQGYYFKVKAAILADPDTSLGTAIPAIDQYNAFLAQDTAKNKNRIISNVGYKVYYYVNKAKDYEKAIEALDEILALDPENSYAKSGKEQLQKILNKRNGTPKPTSSTKPATSSSGGSQTGK